MRHAARRVAATQAFRFGLGLVVSVGLGYVVIRSVDVGRVSEAMSRAAPAALLAGLAFAWLEVAVRAWRWQFLIRPLHRVRYRDVFAYTCIGYFANAVLPARFGDVTRAYLAGTAFGIPRLATLGTIVVERVVDGVSVLAIGFMLGLLVAGAATESMMTIGIALIGIAGLAMVAVAVALLRRAGFASTAFGRWILPLVDRLAAGATALRSPRGAIVVLVLALGAFLFATAALMSVAASVGLALNPLQAGVTMAAIALSTAIPAAPSSLGTYEFAGLTLLTLLGFDPDASLAAVVLVHVVGAVPLALVGLAMAWHRHLRVWRLGSAPADGGELARLGRVSGAETGGR